MNSFGGREGGEEREGEGEGEEKEEEEEKVGDGVMEAEEVKVGVTSENMVVEPKTEDIDAPKQEKDHTK